MGARVLKVRGKDAATRAWLAALLLMPWTHASAQSAVNWRCELEGDVAPEWIRIDASGDWREWQGDQWGESTCTGHAAYFCHQDGYVLVNETFSKDKDTRGTFRVVDRLDTRSGAFHRRVLDSTFILETGVQIEKNFYGHCRAGEAPEVSVVHGSAEPV